MAVATTSAESVTLVTQTRVLPGREGDFAAWQQRVSDAVAKAGGFIDQSLMPPAPPVQLDWVIVQRFASGVHARDWLQSPERAALLREVEGMLVGPVDIHLFEGEGPRLPAAPVSVMIATRVKPGREEDFRRWQQRVAAVESKFPGFQGYKLEPPVPGVQDDWVSVLRFDSDEHLDAWLASDDRKRLLAEAAEFDEGTHLRKVRNGFDAWFAGAEDPSKPPPPGWKYNMLVLLTLYPVVFLLGKWLADPLLIDRWGWPFWLALFASNAISVPLVGSVLAPWAGRRFGWWTQPSDGPFGRTTVIGVGVIVLLYGVWLLLFSLYP
jgi:uncharacterized protein